VTVLFFGIFDSQKYRIAMKQLFAFAIFILISTGMHAQKTNTAMQKIDLLYNEALTLSQQGNSAQSVQKLNEILRLDSTWYMARFALADLCHEAGKTLDEIISLRKGLAFSGDAFPPGFKFLAEALYKTGEYAEAKSRMDHYAALKKTLNPAEQLLRASCDFSVEAVSHPVPFNPVNAGDSINTNAEEYWPSLNAESNELVFTRLEIIDRNGKKIISPQEDFYYSVSDSAGWHKAKPLGSPVNTEENEGAQTLSADGRLLIFTGCGRPGGLGSCDLYISVNRNGKWTMPVNMGAPVNSAAWESQPALSADGNTLYFVSSRRGGKGNMDIWKAVKTSLTPDGLPVFGKVENVSELNTVGNDLSPFLHADGRTLFFASDGLPGLGGKDIFLTRWRNGSWSAPVNLGYPVNSNLNEDGLTVEISGERAWFASARDPLRGRDIYFFTLPDSLRPDPVSYLKGLISDATTGKKLPADVTLTDLKTRKIVRRIYQEENDGDFLVCLPSGINYGVSINRKGYLFASENVSLVQGFTKERPRNEQFRLQPVAPGALTTLKNIFFETDSWQLLEESQSQLGEMELFMKQNPGVVMEVAGHTDNVGTAAYNLELSGKRADAVVQELKKRGIEPWRISSKGFGFKVPVGDNSTEEGRRLNRRTEFLIKEIKK
jgi:outer membrane protein OmpA-like peptidoglycan-associated protein